MIPAAAQLFEPRPEEVDYMRVRIHRYDRRADCPTCDGLLFEIKTDQPGVGQSYFSPRVPVSAFQYYQAQVALFYVDKPYYYSQEGRTLAYIPLLARPAPRQGAAG